MPQLGPEEVRHWHELLVEFDRRVVPHGLERGYSRDALLVSFMLTQVRTTLESVEAALWAPAPDEPREPWQRDDDDEGEPA